MKKSFGALILIYTLLFIANLTWAFPPWIGGSSGSGSGDVTKVGTPANHEWGVWTGDGTLEGVAVTGSKVVCTDADGEPVACTNLTDAAIPDQAALHIDDILTAIGIASEATHLGTFTGSTIADSQTVKAALQALETSLETKGTGDITSVGNCATGACDGTTVTWGDGTDPVVWTFDAPAAGTDYTFTFGSGIVTFSGTLGLGVNNLTMTGSLGATGARLTKGWFADLEITNPPTINGGTLAAGALLTGFSSGAGALAGTDSILAGINKLDGNIGTKLDATAFDAYGDVVALWGAGTGFLKSDGTIVSSKTDNSTASHFLYVDGDSEIENATVTGTGTTMVLATSPALVTPSVGNGETSAGSIYFKEDSNNGTNTAQLIGPASTDDVVITLPASTGTLPVIIASGVLSAHDEGSIASGACSSAVDGGTATGVATTDRIVWNFNGDVTGVTGFEPSASGGLFIYVYPTADHVNFKICNNTAGAKDPGAITINWMVLR